MHIVLVAADIEALLDLIKIILVLVFDAVSDEVLELDYTYVEIVATDSLLNLVVDQRKSIVFFIHIDLCKLKILFQDFPAQMDQGSSYLWDKQRP